MALARASFPLEPVPKQLELLGAQALGAHAGRVPHLHHQLPHPLSRSGRRAGSHRQRAGQRLAAMGEGGVDEGAQRGRRGRAPAAQANEHRVHPGHGMKHAPRDRAQDTHLAGQLGQHRGHPVGPRTGRRGQPLPHLALDHHHPHRHLGQVLDRAQDGDGCDPVRQVGHHPRGSGRQRVELERDGVLHVQGHVGEPVDRVVQRGLEPAIDLDDMEMGHPRRQVLGQDSKSPSDLEHDVIGPELGRALDHSEQVGVDEEVLAEVAIRPHVEAPQAAQAGLAWQRALHRPRAIGPPARAHHPNNPAAFRSTAPSSSS